MRRLIPVVVAAAALTAATTASAQPAPSAPIAIESTHGWSAQAGYETFSLRDVSRNMRPPDASPVSWRGAGPVVSGRYEITRPKSAHLIDVSVSHNGDFVYAGPARTVAAGESDFASRFASNYEYRRYVWRDAGFDGFDIGLGAQGAGTRVAFDRHITPAIASKTRISGGGLAGVVSARVRRWQRLYVEASWANGAIVSLRTTEHSGSGVGEESFSGGNWLSDLLLRADWTLTRATRLTVTWRSSYDYYSSSRFSYINDRQSFNVGVRYAY